MLTEAAREKRQCIIDACRSMNALGINQGTSGNISLRDGEGFLITPTSMPYDLMQPEDIIKMRFDHSVVENGRPSTEWRFHLDVLRARPEVGAIVPTLAIMERSIPPIHYMVCAAGGDTIRCAPYATFGTQELSDKDRKACLLAHHGMIAVGDASAPPCGWRSKSKTSPTSTSIACSSAASRRCSRRKRSRTSPSGSQITDCTRRRIRLATLLGVAARLGLVRPSAGGGEADEACSAAASYQILGLRHVRGHTTPRRGCNDFKPLRRHFPASRRARSAVRPSRAAMPPTEAPRFKRSKIGSSRPAFARRAARRPRQSVASGGRQNGFDGTGHLAVSDSHNKHRASVHLCQEIDRALM